MVVVTSTLMHVKPDKRSEFRQTMALLAERVHLEPECLGCRFTESVADLRLYCWVEEWASEADLERHRATPEAGIVSDTRFLLVEPPRVSIDYVVRREAVATGK